MKRTLPVLLLVALFGLLVSCAQPGVAPTAVPPSATQALSTPAASAIAATPAGTAPALSFDELTPLATTFVDQLVQGDFTAATSRFDPTMQAALPEAKLKDTWQQLLAQAGPFQKRVGTHTAEAQGYKIVFVTCQFEKAAIDVQVVFSPQGQIAGLFFKPAQASLSTPQPYDPPAYVKTAAFHESDVTVGSGDWKLPGTLSLPNGDGPFPAVVLVHGSGPNDRDETIGPNKPFRDLAWGLASQGIAVLRYDKRTLVHAAQFTPQILASLTVKEETTDDALLAVQLLRQTQAIDPKRVFVLGHSLGAMLAPRIGRQDSTLAGLVIMAGPTRPLEDVVLDQVAYLDSLAGTPSAQQQAALDNLRAQVARVKDPGLSTGTPAADLPLGINAAYWLDLRGYQPAVVAQSLAMPMLILQGARDYQVSPTADFNGWQTALAGKANVTLKLYPALNHLFIAGQGQPNPQEYDVVGHVDAAVVGDIAGFISKSPPGG